MLKERNWENILTLMIKFDIIWIFMIRKYNKLAEIWWLKAKTTSQWVLINLFLYFDLSPLCSDCSSENSCCSLETIQCSLETLEAVEALGCLILRNNIETEQKRIDCTLRTWFRSDFSFIFLWGLSEGSIIDYLLIYKAVLPHESGRHIVPAGTLCIDPLWCWMCRSPRTHNALLWWWCYGSRGRAPGSLSERPITKNRKANNKCVKRQNVNVKLVQTLLHLSASTQLDVSDSSPHTRLRDRIPSTGRWKPIPKDFTTTRISLRDSLRRIRRWRRKKVTMCYHSNHNPDFDTCANWPDLSLTGRLVSHLCIKFIWCYLGKPTPNLVLIPKP